MKNIFLTYIVAATFLVACETKQNDSVKEAENLNQEKIADSTTKVSKEDEEFAVKFGAGGREEIALGKLAEEKGELKEVREFGKHMAHQHKQICEELKELAAKKNISLPDSLSPEGKSAKEELEKLHGRKFDVAYMNAMVEGHKKVLASMEKENADTKDPDIKAFTEKTIPIIKEHLQMAETTDSLAKADDKKMMK